MERVEVRVLFFGKAKELAEVEQSKISFPANTSYEGLKRQIFHEEFPALEPIESSCILALDQRYLDNGEEVHLTTLSEIAVIPPLSGG